MIESIKGIRGYKIHDTEHLEQEARIALEFIVRWGCVAAIEDGEDSAGRRQLRLLTESELVERGTNTAYLLMKHFRENNLIHKLPSMKDFEEEVK